MAGHSKWANIKHKKAVVDARRGKVFTKVIRELVVAAKGGPNPDDNPRLRGVIDKALGANMKRDTIDKAIARGAGNAGADNYEECTYEGYAPGGVAVLVECMTDNRNRTVAAIRHVFSKRGGNLGTDGSVAYLFAPVGQISYAPGIDEDALMDAALEAGAEDIESADDGSVNVVTSRESFAEIRQRLIDLGLEPDHAEMTMVASVQMPMDKGSAEKILAMVEELEDMDDVQNVYTNAEISSEIMD